MYRDGDLFASEGWRGFAGANFVDEYDDIWPTGVVEHCVKCQVPKSNGLGIMMF